MSHIAVLLGRAERLTARAPKGLFRFLCVGVFGLATQLGVFDALHRLGAAKAVAWMAGLAISMVVTWQLNRRLTFVATGRRRGAEIARYALVTAVAQGVSFLVFSTLNAVQPWLQPSFPAVVAPLIANVWPDASLITGAVTATLFSYSGQRFFTFAPSKPQAAVEATTQEVPAA